MCNNIKYYSPNQISFQLLICEFTLVNTYSRYPVFSYSAQNVFCRGENNNADAEYFADNNAYFNGYFNGLVDILSF